MLTTGLVKLHNNIGQSFLVRAFLDNGSELNIISERLTNKANLLRRKYSIEIEGVTGSQWLDCSIVNATMSPWFDEQNEIRLFKTFITMKVLPAVQRADFSPNIEEFQQLQKADPRFYKASAVDLLLGIDTWTDIILERIIRSKIGLVAQATTFGYTISGTIKGEPNQSSIATFNHVAIKNESSKCLDDLLRKFWEEEELPEERIFSEAEMRAEEFFEKTTMRAENGRFIVRLPLINDNPELGDSRRAAVERFYQLERRLDRNKELREQYCAAMMEAIDLNQMRIATAEERAANGYYIPHHPITKRFRIVKDGSCVTTNGKSVNDIQLAGPNLQEKLPHIIMRFRFHKHVLSADIRKMFLQILLNQEDLKYHKIFWRFNKNEPLREYVLLTVTFGMKASPYLANKCMFKLAEIYQREFPLAAQATRCERYIDDFMSGADTIETLEQLYVQLIEMLAKAKFELAKWKTNCPYILERINENLSENDQPLHLKDEVESILGLKWHPNSDCFVFKIDEQWNDKPITKRTVSSAIARIYDPCGFLAPVVLTAKAFLQELWKLKVEWDKPLDNDVANRWRTFYESLSIINEIRIPRWIQTTQGREIELIGFSDASIIGYGAVVYVRCLSGQDVWSNMLATKTKVAPVRTETIPRLELCAAVLLAQLMRIVREKCSLEYVPYHCYSDSNITLGWIRSCPSALRIYVGARVKQIQKNTHKESWSYVPSKENPADIASRGMSPKELKDCELWWHGPRFICAEREQVRFTQPTLSEIEQNALLAETRPRIVASLRATHSEYLSRDNLPLIEWYGRFNRAIRITAYVFQAVKRFQRKYRAEPNTQGLLTTEELNNAIVYWAKYTQSIHFGEELSCLRSNVQLSKKSRLKQLSPFLGGEGLMRVRGRLENANITYDEKHPIIVPYKSTFARRLMHLAHHETLHGGPQLMLHYVRAKYWILNDREAARSTWRHCGRCYRYMKHDRSQLMADLPKERLANTRPFANCGVDYFGPIKIKRFEGRCKTVETGYGAVFVCMSTRMVHIECVSDMTSNKFLWALSRLVAIYGMPEIMFSDNAKTFKGAENELKTVLESWKSPEVENFITTKGLRWKYITPRAPNQGGLWEAAVKSAKYHMERMLNGHIFTFERLQTLFAKISSVLNSRPLVPLSSDPLELNYLTPSHAMIGGRVVQPLCSNLSEIPINRVTQYKLLDKIHQEFWNVWRREYIGSLQTRYKWNRAEGNLHVNDVVLLKEDNVPPGAWPIARVIEVYPGADGLVRSVKIRTAKNDLQRPALKLAKLPFQDDSS